jgi:hypothetical protein
MIEGGRLLSAMCGSSAANIFRIETASRYLLLHYCISSRV